MAGAGDNIVDLGQRVRQRVRAPDMQSQADGEDGDYLDRAELPPECPVTPLGIQGLRIWVLDAANQLIQMPTDCRKGDMTLIFGGTNWLIEHYPQYPKPSKDNPRPEPNGFNQAEVQAALITVCQQRGIFNPQGRVFGRGANRTSEDEDRLILHMGKSVIVAGQTDKKGRVSELIEYRAGRIGDSYFPAYDALPGPAEEPSTPEEAKALWGLFRQWQWVEPDAATLLLLGMTAQMFICGALSWRSHAWLTGPTAAGKTTLQKVIRAIHYRWCLFTEDASEAAVRQVLNDDTLPVMIDEAEADDNPEKQRAILNLAKKASSGAKMHRGSSDHKAQEFTAQSCFLFSSVLHSLVKGEELNRVAVLEMRQLPRAETQWEAPDLVHWRTVGRRMHRRMIEQWPRFARTLADYKREIWSHGIEGRWQDTYGTLLACADCLLYDAAPSAESMANDEFGREKEWVRIIMPMLLRGKSAARTDVDRCIAHLMSKMIPGAHGQAAETIGQWINRAMSPYMVHGEVDGPSGGINHTARERLKSQGLRLIELDQDELAKKKLKLKGEPLPDSWETGFLAVAYPTHSPMLELFKGSEWAGGHWLQSLGKIEGARPGMKMRFGGMNADYALCVPLKALRAKEGE